MATILNQITIGDALYLVVNSNPASGAGTVAPIGSLATDNTTGLLYAKTGSSNTSWSTSTLVNSGNTIVRYLNFGVTGNSGSPFVTTSSTSYAAIQDFVFKPTEHILSGSTLTFVFKAILGFSSTAQSANARIFNQTTNSSVSNSVIAIPTNQPTPTTQTIYTSASLTASDFNNSVDNIFECQVQKVLGSGSITVYGFQLAIINSF